MFDRLRTGEKGYILYFLVCAHNISGAAVMSRRILCSRIQLKTRIPLSSYKNFGWTVCRQREQITTFAQQMNFELFKLFI